MADQSCCHCFTYRSSFYAKWRSALKKQKRSGKLSWINILWWSFLFRTRVRLGCDTKVHPLPAVNQARTRGVQNLNSFMIVCQVILEIAWFFFEFLGFYSNYDFFLDMMCGWKLIHRDSKADILRRAQALHNDGQLSDFSLVSSVRVRLVCFPSVMDKYFSFWSFAIVFVCGGYQRYKPNCCARCAMILKFLILDLNFALV